MDVFETKSVAKFSTPFAKQVEIMEVKIRNGVVLLRIRIKEGNRFTILDLDPVSAKLWGEAMSAWSEKMT